MKKEKVRFLVFAAHPDDAEIGMGGTIGKLTRAGIEVKVVDLTDGEPTPCGSREIRKKEKEAAAKILGFERETPDWKNRRLEFSIEKRDHLASIIRRWRPEAVFFPLAKDTHPDHRETSKICGDAIFAARLTGSSIYGDPLRVEKNYSYPGVHLKKAISPQIYVPLTEEEYSLKMMSLKSYASQFKENLHNVKMLDFIESRDRYFGYICGSKYAEGFFPGQGAEADFLKYV